MKKSLSFISLSIVLTISMVLTTGCKKEEEETETAVSETTTVSSSVSVGIDDSVIIGESDSEEDDDDDEWIPIRSHSIDYPIDGLTDYSLVLDDDYSLVDADSDKFNRTMNKFLNGDCSFKYSVDDEVFVYHRSGVTEFVEGKELSVLINEQGKFFLNNEKKTAIPESLTEEWYDCDADCLVQSVLNDCALNLQAIATIDGQQYDRYELYDDYQQSVFVYAQNELIKLISYYGLTGERVIIIEDYSSGSGLTGNPLEGYKVVSSVQEFNQ